MDRIHANESGYQAGTEGENVLMCHDVDALIRLT